MTTVQVGNERVRLTDLLGRGSMADVYRARVSGKDVAVKIYQYNDPEKEPMRPIRAKKIPLMTSMQLPDAIYPPRQPAYSDTGSEFLGFAMDLFPRGYIPLGEMYSESFWAANLFSPTKALAVMRGLREFVLSVHKANLVICDFNPGNAQFTLSNLGSVIGGDADSYQIPGFNGIEIHRDYGAPRLANIDLSHGAMPFLPEDDWWSYYIHFVTALTRGGHPFRGKGKWFNEMKQTYKNTMERVLAGVSIFDQRAEPVGQSLPIVIMPDEVLSHLAEVLVTKKRAQGPMPEWVLGMAFQRCPACSQEHARKSCPFCKKVVFVQQVISTAKIERTVIFQSKFAIAASALDNEDILLIVRQGNKFVHFKCALDGQVKLQQEQALILDPNRDYEVKLGPAFTAVADADSLTILQSATGQVASKTTTTNFLSKPIFSVGAHVYRGVGSSIMAWQNAGGIWGFRPVPAQVPSGATWYQATMTGLVIMTLVNGRYEWTLLQGNFRHKLEVQGLRSNERIVRQYAVSDSSSVVVLRIVESTRGKIATLVDHFDIASKKLSSSRYDEEPIDQAAYLSGVLLFASDEGIVRWKLGEDPKTLPGTEQFVAAGTKLYLVGKGTIVAVTNSKVSILKAK